MFDRYLHSIRVGFEIESEVDSDRLETLELGVNNYHSFRKQRLGTRPIRVESDASIVCTKKNTIGAEFITYPLKLNSAFRGLSKQLKELTGCEENEDFTDVLNFNESTGAHIHISANSIDLKDMIMNEDFLKHFDKNIKVALEDYPEVLNHFYRSYAKKFKYHELWRERHNWLNYNSKWKTVEIRGSNLIHIKTIKDIKNIYEAIIKCFFVSIDQHLKAISEEVTVTLVKEPSIIQEEDVVVDTTDRDWVRIQGQEEQIII